MHRPTIILGTITVILLIVLAYTRTIILGSTHQIHLQAAAPLTGQISQSFTNNNKTTLPVAGTDYTLTGTRYFDNGQWAVTTIKPITSAVTAGTVILKQKQGVYTVVLGPGTSFPSTYTQSLPTDIQQYLNANGAVYVPNNQ